MHGETCPREETAEECDEQEAREWACGEDYADDVENRWFYDEDTDRDLCPEHGRMIRAKLDTIDLKKELSDGAATEGG